MKSSFASTAELCVDIRVVSDIAWVKALSDLKVLGPVSESQSSPTSQWQIGRRSRVGRRSLCVKQSKNSLMRYRAIADGCQILNKPNIWLCREKAYTSYSQWDNKASHEISVRKTKGRRRRRRRRRREKEGNPKGVIGEARDDAHHAWPRHNTAGHYFFTGKRFFAALQHRQSLPCACAEQNQSTNKLQHCSLPRSLFK